MCISAVHHREEEEVLREVQFPCHAGAMIAQQCHGAAAPFGCLHPTSVKSALVSEFKIDASRLETDGKGESQPIDKNDNPAGKANNRRVEFIKK